VNGPRPVHLSLRSAKSERLLGALFVALSAAAFGAMAIFGKLAYAAGVGLPSLLFLRFALAGLVLAGLMLLQRRAWPRGRNLWLLLGMGGIGYVGQAYCYFSALQYASAGLTALLLYLFPAIVTVLSAIRAGRMLSPLRIAAVSLALLGTLLTVGGDASGSSAGIVLGIGAAVIYSFYILVGEKVTGKEGAIASAAVVMLGAAVGAAAVALVTGFSPPGNATGWSALLAIALLSTVAAIVLFFAGLRRLGAPDTSTLSTLEPVMTIGLAAIFLGEAVTPLQLLGGAIILGAVIALARYGGRDELQKSAAPAA
jgi:drug/metabolite transporter (DMT)-like permease